MSYLSGYHHSSAEIKLTATPDKIKLVAQFEAYLIYLLTVVRTHVKAGDNSFVVAAATLWNALPSNIKTSACLATSKARLKTYFF